MKRNVCIALLALVVTGKQSATAQTTLPAWTEVRLALAGNVVVEGRLSRGDANALTVRTASGELVTVQRADILLLTATTSPTMDHAFRSGLVVGAMTAIVFGAYSARCRAPNDCAPSTPTMWAGGALGLALGSAVAATVATPTQEWRAVAPNLRVDGQPTGLTAPEACQFTPAAKADVGLSTAGSRSLGFAVTFFCHRGVTLGGEQGTPRHLADDRSTYVSTGTMSTNSYYAHWHDATFFGGFAEIPVGSMFNPRLIVSAGRYHREDRWATTVTTYSAAPYSQTQAGATTSSNHLGGGLGLSVSIPCLDHLSVGFDARAHYLVGAGGGTIGTLGTTVTVR